MCLEGDVIALGEQHSVADVEVGNGLWGSYSDTGEDLGIVEGTLGFRGAECSIHKAIDEVRSTEGLDYIVCTFIFKDSQFVAPFVQHFSFLPFETVGKGEDKVLQVLVGRKYFQRSGM
ncbi:hypothetical protein EVA_18553 [gut metagenome]|uniref:Uncharacterized protein n=1 Tax=gut metagenome TaxID=749906 RepID=J9G164_9ZZZZ